MNTIDSEFEIEGNQEFESYFRRCFNQLKEESIIIRKQAIINIYNKLKDNRQIVSGAISQKILLRFTKDLLKSMSDSVEAVREYSILTLKEILSRCEDMENALPYIFAVICERTNCHDLEGILHLPDVMRPPPDQKPKMLIQLIEPSEELRLQIVELLHIILQCNDSNTLREYLDEIVNCLRALCMDPYSEVQKAVCQTLSEFCRNNHEILLHFTETLARALLFPLISKKSKVKIVAIEAIGSVLKCGIWKHNAFVFEILTGFRDPNSVPIKAFYEPIHNINYLATLIIDSKMQVREMFISCVGDWLTILDDRWDHHGRLMPYIVSGLFDESDDIREIAYDTIEQVGIQWEIEREKDIKEARQLGIESEWTQNGKLSNLPLPKPFTQRPRLGARGFVRSQVRKMWPALYKELKDINENNQWKASNLILMGVIYSEDQMTQFLDQFIPNTITFLVSKEGDSKIQIKTANKIKEVYRLLGRFCDFKSYVPMIFSSLRGQYCKDEWYMKCSMEAINQLLNGSLEATVSGEGLGNKIQFIEQVVDLIAENNQIEFISQLNLNQAQDLMNTLIVTFQEYANEQEIILFFQNKAQQILMILGVLQYLNQYGTTIILNMPFDSNCLQNTLRQIHHDKSQSLRKILINKLERKDMLDERNIILQSNLSNLNFQNTQWKNIISELTCAFLDNIYPNSISKTVEISIKQLNIPEITDFLLKYVYIILSTANEKQISKNSFSLLIEFTAQCLEWLALTDQKYSNTLIKLFQNQIQKTLNLFASKDTFSINWKQIQKDQICLQNYTKLIISLITIQKKYFKTSFNDNTQLLHQITHILLPYPNSKYLESDGKYLLTELLYYTFDQIALLGDNPKQETRNQLINIIKLIIQYIPNSEDQSYYQGENHTVPQYQKFLGKLIKLTVEEKDLQGKEKFIEILKSLHKKTSHNFYVEMEQAKYGNQLTRVELLASIMS